MASNYNDDGTLAEASVGPKDAGMILLEVVHTLRAFRVAGQHQGRHAIAGTQVGVLHCLTRDDARVSDIAKQLVMSTSVVSRAVETLEHDGLVRRRSDQADGRASVISLTEKGRADLAQRYQYVSERFATGLQDWTPAEKEDALRILQRLNTNLDQLTEVLVSDERDNHSA
ncbi:MarR family winged helix-turn-helix transcriptional regulator [Microbacterium esteraromaticum]|nr:MarR family transcriptional regulator [Microbacterium esteraromaticum]